MPYNDLLGKKIDSVTAPLTLSNYVLGVNYATESTSGVVIIKNTYPSPVSTTDATTSTYVQDAIAAAITSGKSFRGGYDASTNLFPSSGGSGAGGAINAGDFWTITVGGTLGGTPVFPNDNVLALVNVPGQTSGNWAINSSNLTFNSSEFTVSGNEVSLKTGGITLELMEPNGTDGKLLTSGSDTNPPKYRTLLGTSNQINVTLNTDDITLSGPQDLAQDSTPTFVTVRLMDVNDDVALISDGSGNIISSVTTSSELSFVNGVTSNIQTQLDGKQPTGDYITELTGDVLATGPGSVSSTIANSAVTLAKMADLPANTIIGNNTGVSDTPIALTKIQAKLLLGPTVITESGTSLALDSTFDGVNMTNAAARAVSIAASELVVGKEWFIKDAAFNVAGGNITITPEAPLLIDNQSTYVIISNVAGPSITIYNDGTNFFVR